jgi:hypothetical protein
MLTTRIAIGLCTFLSTVSVYAQTRHPQYANIQFKFLAGEKELPPGRYKISQDIEAAPYVTIRSMADNSMVQLQVHTQLARQGAPGMDDRKVRLVFDRVGDTRYLSEIWLPGQDGLLVHGTTGDHQHEVVVTVVSSLSTDHSGKEIYEATCANCHGPQGEGDQAADKKFQTTVPRLRSDSVQSKSDEELKDIITHGRRKMEPVRMGKLTVKHLLDAESVDAVIAYVRTFKPR